MVRDSGRPVENTLDFLSFSYRVAVILHDVHSAQVLCRVVVVLSKQTLQQPADEVNMGHFTLQHFTGTNWRRL